MIYNKRLDEWTEDNAPTLPVALRYHNMVHANRQKTKILVAGGKWSDAVHVYDWNRKIWTYIGKMSRGLAENVGLSFFKASKSDKDKVK